MPNFIKGIMSSSLPESLFPFVNKYEWNSFVHAARLVVTLINLKHLQLSQLMDSLANMDMVATIVTELSMVPFVLFAV